MANVEVIKAEQARKTLDKNAATSSQIRWRLLHGQTLRTGAEGGAAGHLLSFQVRELETLGFRFDNVEIPRTPEQGTGRPAHEFTLLNPEHTPTAMFQPKPRPKKAKAKKGAKKATPAVAHNGAGAPPRKTKPVPLPPAPEIGAALTVRGCTLDDDDRLNLIVRNGAHSWVVVVRDYATT